MKKQKGETKSPRGEMKKQKGETKSPKGETEKMFRETQSAKGEMKKRFGEMKSEIAGAAEIVSVWPEELISGVAGDGRRPENAGHCVVT